VARRRVGRSAAQAESGMLAALVSARGPGSSDVRPPPLRITTCAGSDMEWGRGRLTAAYARSGRDAGRKRSDDSASAPRVAPGSLSRGKTRRSGVSFCEPASPWRHASGASAPTSEAVARSQRSGTHAGRIAGVGGGARGWRCSWQFVSMARAVALPSVHAAAFTGNCRPKDCYRVRNGRSHEDRGPEWRRRRRERPGHREFCTASHVPSVS